MNDDYQIRLARPWEIPLLPEIERAAGRLFAGLDLVQDSEDDTRSIEELERAQEARCLWVATEPSGQPVGFAVAIKVDGAAHLDELEDSGPEVFLRNEEGRLLDLVDSLSLDREVSDIFRLKSGFLCR